MKKNLTKNVNKLSGHIENLTGDVSGLRGNIDSCEITEEERKKGIDIKKLVKSEGK